MTDSSFTGVRIATQADEPAIYELLIRMHGENGMFSMSEKKVRDTMYCGTRPNSDPNSSRGVVGVVDGPKGLEATIGLVVSTVWYSDDWHINELWNFVHPDYRTAGHAPKLIKFSQWCATQMDLPLLIGVVSNKRTEAKVRLYKRLLPYTGAFFMWGGKNGPDMRNFPASV